MRVLIAAACVSLLATTAVAGVPSGGQWRFATRDQQGTVVAVADRSRAESGDFAAALFRFQGKARPDGDAIYAISANCADRTLLVEPVVDGASPRDRIAHAMARPADFRAPPTRSVGADIVAHLCPAGDPVTRSLSAPPIIRTMPVPVQFN